MLSSSNNYTRPCARRALDAYGYDSFETRCRLPTSRLIELRQHLDVPTEVAIPD